MTFKQILSVIPALGESDVPVMLRGAPGVGKCEIAVKIHQSGSRNEGPFITLNCIPGEAKALELELFGNEESIGRGGYPGRLSYINGGTLYLREVGNLPLETQSRLLEVLMEKRLPPCRGRAPIPLDVRLIAGSHKDLETEVEMGRFREDFYDYLHRVTLYIPPLRESRDSLPFVVSSFLSEIGRGERQGFGSSLEISDEAMLRLCAYPWPGNLRELNTILQRAAVFSAGAMIKLEHLSLPSTSSGIHSSTPAVGETRVSIGHAVAGFFCEKAKQLYKNGVISLQKRSTLYSEVIEEVEKSMIQSAIRLSAGNKLKAAKMLGITRTTIRKKMVEYGL